MGAPDLVSFRVERNGSGAAGRVAGRKIIPGARLKSEQHSAIVFAPAWNR